MEPKLISSLDAYHRLKLDADRLNRQEFHLKYLLEQENRFERFSMRRGDLWFDFSKQRLDQKTVDHLLELAKARETVEQFRAMADGQKVNTTEQRSAMHMDARNGSHPEMNQVNQRIRSFVQDVGDIFSDVVVVGIGGSYLGTEFVYQALQSSCKVIRPLHFLSNVDMDDFAAVIKKINPQKTLWVVVSKSYTTMETLANLAQVTAFLKANHLEPRNHIVTITAKGSPGDQSEAKSSGEDNGDILASFHMFDFIGGRYSVTSAVGVLPLSLCFGYPVIERFLKGCGDMDQHAGNAEPKSNMPLTAALISIWNSHFLEYPAQAIIPYSSALSRLSPHIQQLYMESLGKQASIYDSRVEYPTGVIIFGEPGTNAQHSFFQLAHQGAPFPIDFIGVLSPGSTKIWSTYQGVTNHQELWANLLAQTQALALGKTDDNIHKVFEGNRPSSTIVIKDLGPESVGALLAFYEARTVFEGFILGINPFDQFGVELGKTMAKALRGQMALKNGSPDHQFDVNDPATRFYLNELFKAGRD